MRQVDGHQVEIEAGDGKKGGNEHDQVGPSGYRLVVLAEDVHVGQADFNSVVGGHTGDGAGEEEDPAQQGIEERGEGGNGDQGISELLAKGHFRVGFQAFGHIYSRSVVAHKSV